MGGVFVDDELLPHSSVLPVGKALAEPVTAALPVSRPASSGIETLLMLTYV